MWYRRVLLYVGTFNMGTMECAYMWYHILGLPFKTSIYGTYSN